MGMGGFPHAESPTTLDDARDLSRERQLPEADSAELELSKETSWTTTPLAAAVISHSEFLFLCFFSDGRRSSHSVSYCCLNGIPNCRNNSLASSSVRAVVTIVTFIPRILSTFSYEISGKIN
jgi:hypothetical protein